MHSFLAQVVRNPGQVIKRYLTRLLCCACILLLPLSLGLSQAQARPRSFLTIDNIGDVNFGTWVNAGLFSSATDFCIESWSRGSAVDYKIRVISFENPGSLYLYRSGDASATGNQRIAVDFIHSDLIGSGGQETLLASQYDQIDNEGQRNNCDTGGNNARLRIELSAQALNAAAAGNYSGSFSLEADNGSTDSVTFDVSVEVQGSPEVRISDLDDLDFGLYGAGRTGNLQASERFCVYSSESSYRLSVSSSNQDGGGNFYLTSGGTDDAIPMDVLFADRGTGAGTEPVGNQSLSGVGNNTADDCGGGNNATLTFTVQESDLRASSSGVYSDSVVLLVQPE
ncbi:MAG: hypothetical protein WD396_00480 [Pseudohongiellaceae bacterium]